MKKYFSKNLIYFLLIIASFVLVVYLFDSFRGNEEDIGVDQKIDEEDNIKDDLVSVFVENNKIILGKDNVIFSTTLNPSFRIKHADVLDIKNIFVDKIDVLSDEFFIEEGTIKKEGDAIFFIFPFLLKPGKHNLKIVGERENNNVVRDFSFNLGLLSYFDETIENSQFLLIPDTTQKKYDRSWFVENSKLKINSIPEGDYASLSFLYPFVDINVSFEFIPYGENISLVFYFLDSGRSIIIGNGDNNRIALLRGGPAPDNVVKGKEFKMVPGKTYSVFIVRSGGNYKLSIAEGTIEATKENLTENNLLLDFADPTRIDYVEDYVGFSAWKDSDGLEIDNLFVSTE